ncbi:DNA topoisomerase [Suhomyces tanzawaensis NRRL Y-17324]|uniref:DNA topoisomerase n=1 Tax=Suhomyces tanzawaensis NRRL Y-17324 TaxID=984487 RepID=A0A1E4SGP0_9ASCO|nr:DNA topoisomerase [Suhomyces tanzawaensis NRRL Y-17324]ODV78582.1 DNA topoisomerase [Suhomyces tanzawaensis NRRL Y-17324]
MNYDFSYRFPIHGACEVTMTSVLGHLTGIDFPPPFQWGKCVPGRLFDADIVEKVLKQDVYDNIANEAAKAQLLMIWTDCDREGEYIGYEIYTAARKGNHSLEIAAIWRSKFSHLERNHVIAAANNPIGLDMKSVEAVACRQEVDFRVGTSFTRLLTDGLRQHKIIEQKEVASYGTCQFPTLGFIVDRYRRVKSFIPEQFWYLAVEVKHEGVAASFSWVTGHLFDRLYVLILYQQCLEHDQGTITKLDLKRTTNWRPLPLTTVELQKDCSRLFKMSAKNSLAAAEKLYNKGFLSYPRTETDSFPASMDFSGTLQKQAQDSRWGLYASGLVQNGFQTPRNGKYDDKAHPAIHPVNYVDISSLSSPDERKVYEYVVRRFLACCSKDAVGQQTTATLKWGDQFFTASGLVVLEKNYLDIYTYKKWETTKQLPNLTEGQTISISSGRMKDGKTSPPKHMTEPELIALMDANGIGTDATIADHIEKVLSRGYIMKQKQASVEYIIPSDLGMGLIEGLDAMGFDNISLSKPFMRKQLEELLQEIVVGTKTKPEVLGDIKHIYRQAYAVTSRNMAALARSCTDIMART